MRAPAPAPIDTSKPLNPGGHQMVEPPSTLKQRAYVPMRSNDPDPEKHVSMAENALEEISINFSNWMLAETDRLDKARKSYRSETVTDEAVELLFQACHHVRGNAGVFGYPLASRIADSLCKLLDRCREAGIPAVLVDQHVDAIRAMVREDARGMDHPKARELTIRLIEVTAEYMDKVAPEAPRSAA